MIFCSVLRKAIQIKHNLEEAKIITIVDIAKIYHEY